MKLYKFQKRFLERIYINIARIAIAAFLVLCLGAVGTMDLITRYGVAI